VWASANRRMTASPGSGCRDCPRDGDRMRTTMNCTRPKRRQPHHRADSQPQQEQQRGNAADGIRRRRQVMVQAEVDRRVGPALTLAATEGSSTADDLRLPPQALWQPGPRQRRPRSHVVGTITISDDGIAGDLGYPSTVQLADNTLVTVWYERSRLPQRRAASGEVGTRNGLSRMSRQE